MSDLIGKTIGQYEIVEKIGAGGMATVFKAYQASINRFVAVKILPVQFAQDPNFVKRFAQEAKAIAALEHPHILPVYDFGTDEGLTYMAMRYVEGGTLANLMGTSMPYRRIVEVVSNVARALDYAHSQGVVHRDIKPSNILIDKHGEVLLTDFGIAKMMQGPGSTQLTGTGSILGTPEYMSPEQAEGVGIDQRSDIYSLGVVLYELLTGRPPYQAQTPLAVVLKHVNEPLRPPREVKADIPLPLENVVLKSMAKKKEERYQSAAEMEQALKAALKEIEGGLPTATIPAPTTQDVAQPVVAPVKSGGAMKPLLIIGGLAAVLLCVGAIAIFGLLAVVGSGSGESLSGDEPESGDVTISEDLFQTTPENQPTSEVEPASDEQTTPETEPVSEDRPTPETAQVTPTNSVVEQKPTLPPLNLDRDILFEETFTTNDVGWRTVEEDDEYGHYVTSFNDGRYRLSQTAARDVFVWEQLTDINFDNFALAVEAMPVESNTDSYGYGLTFRNNQDFTSLYAFEIDTDGFFINKIVDGEWTTLVEYTLSPAINVDGPNQLLVVAVGPLMTFYINGEEVATVEDDSLPGGSVGVALDLYEAGNSATVDFDNLTIYALTEEELAGLGDTSILFEDYFDSDSNGWATGEFEDDYSFDEITIEDGVYTLQVTTKESAFVEKKLPNLEFSDFVLTVEATPHDTAGGDYYYGVGFRENSDSHVYTFEIGNDGFYAVFLYDGEWKKLKDWSSSNAINVGETNELKVVAKGETLTFFVNGEQLTTLQDNTLAEGQVGLIVDMFEAGQTAAVDFDNLVISRVE
jgi:serine/threonine protein kinase